MFQQRNNDLQAKVHILHKTLDEAHQRLASAENAISHWPVSSVRVLTSRSSVVGDPELLEIVFLLAFL